MKAGKKYRLFLLLFYKHLTSAKNYIMKNKGKILEIFDMKKTFLIVSLAVLAACSDLSQYTTVDSNASAKTRMKACMISEANSRFQAGTLFTSGVSAVADDIVNTCIKKLALQSAGISEESQSTAQNIINNLKNFGTAN